MWKIVGSVILVLASIFGGAVLGCIIGAIYVPIKVFAWLYGEDSSNGDEVYSDDEI